MPEFSVVMSAYDCGQWIGEAIQSVLEQTFKDFELIVADDGSNDNTAIEDREHKEYSG